VKEEVRAEGAPAPIGPYSQGIVASGKMLFVAGQTPKDPVTGAMPQSFSDQVEQCMRNVKAIVEKAGGSMADVVKVNAYLADLANFKDFNEIYSKYFTKPYPARTTVGAVLPGGAVQVEIDVVVSLPH
jgi:reactive intermediate/imine deaminase